MEPFSDEVFDDFAADPSLPDDRPSDGSPPLRDIEQVLRSYAQQNPDDPQLARAHDWVASLIVAENPRRADNVAFRKYQLQDFTAILAEQGIRHGRVCELGGAQNSFANDMQGFDFTFLSLYPTGKRSGVVVADATNCDHLPAEQFDAIFSTSVFEHVSKPWLAAANVTRLLKPGGVMYHAAPFSYFYHGAPADFWRYTPDAMKLLFSDLRPIKAEFYGRNRRRDNRGSPANPVDRDGGPQFAVDGFGGWRENWFTIYAGVKDPEYAAGVLETAKQQTVVNLMKQLIVAGAGEGEAIERVHEALRHARVSRDQELSACDESESNFCYDTEAIAALWRRRGRAPVPRPSYNRFVMSRRLGLE